MPSDILANHPEIALAPGATLRDAMKVMTKLQISIALVASPRRKLLGVITDIDIRRALLSGGEMSTPISKVMNPKPATLSDAMTREEISNVFREHSRAYMPIVDKSGKLKGLAAMLDYALVPKRFPNRVVVMAGGAGKRLLPLTKNTPKPMLRLGNKPILELLLDQFIAAGFGRFVFTVNYLADQIQDHFGNGKVWGVEIDYVHEEKPMGTVGALALLAPKHLQDPLLVVNGDILTKVNFAALLEFHQSEGALATLCVKHHEIQVPYGVVELRKRRLEAFVEKPVHRWLVNAGIYVIEPKALGWLAKNRSCDMPEFISEIRRRRKDGVACFPIQEYWLDIGGPKEFHQANGEYETLFDQ
ncbi:MAG: nucleotidyltransferase family protein [Elusimicrobia bacterium]|nr:nucleotidyltransferase family protein [Elusimicrobiota bacterium]